MLFLIGLSAAATVTWSVAEGAEYPKLVATVDGKTVQGGERPLLQILYTGDFNGDGTADVLIAWSASGGGNCCPPDYSFVTVKDGKLVEAQIPVYAWEHPSALPDSSGTRFSFTEEEKYTVVRFTGSAAEVAKSSPRANLTAVAEVKGATPGSTGSRTMSADINGDGKKETITCEIWERWGSLLCTLPLPAGPQTLSTGCDRFGVLATKTNGYNDMVCNQDILLKYNGKEYAEVK